MAPTPNQKGRCSRGGRKRGPRQWERAPNGGGGCGVVVDVGEQRAERKRAWWLGAAARARKDHWG
eukprot:10880373-Lingulodinium_polyedra.AAC.1